jgi:hypothetical protein
MRSFSGSYLLLFIQIFFVCCSKKQETPSVRIQVVEYKTNNPIAGTEVLYVSYSLPCTSFVCNPDIYSTTTDKNGYCAIPESVFNNQDNLITIPYPPSTFYPKPPDQHSSSKIYSVSRQGQGKLHLTRINNYPNGYYIELKLKGEQSSDSELFIGRFYGLDSDSSILFTGFGRQTNSVSWNVFNSTDSLIAKGGPGLIDLDVSNTNETEIKY